MKVCVPVESNNGFESKAYGHFGSAPLFIVCDLESNEIKEINNQDLHHEHGKCQPLKALQGNIVDAVIVGGIGQGAIMKLNSMGVKVYKSQGNTIQEDLELFKSNRLVQFPSNHSCNHHGCGHH
ncbi:MAG: NifB/NifX family molybdenum-iron cluster-binding protein [Peptostreptococcaceae bacterium]